MHRLLIISRPRILFENNAPFPLYRSYVFPSPQTCSFRFIFLVPGCFPFLRLFIFLLAPSPCFLSSLAARFPSFHSPPLPLHPTLSLISLDPAPPSLSFSIFFSSYSYSTLPSLTSLMSTVYFHHLASSLSLLSLFLFPRPAPCLLSSTFNFARERRRKGGEGGGKKRRPFVYVLQVSRIYVFCIWYFSLRVHLMHPSSGRERCHFGIFVFHLLPSPFESRPITFISIRDPSHFFRPFHGRLFVEAVDSRVQNLIIENPDFPMK